MPLNDRCLLLVVLLCILLLPACAAKDKKPEDVNASVPAAEHALYPHKDVVAVELDDYDQSPVQLIADPMEPWNRFWFHFNDIFYLYVARPLYRGYDFIMPDEFQSGLKNFLTNLLFPVRFVNNLLQGKPMDAGVEFGRFIVNSTVGFGGFIDVAKANGFTACVFLTRRNTLRRIVSVPLLFAPGTGRLEQRPTGRPNRRSNPGHQQRQRRHSDRSDQRRRPDAGPGAHGPVGPAAGRGCVHYDGR